MDAIWTNDVNEVMSDEYWQRESYDRYLEDIQDPDSGFYGDDPLSFDDWLNEYWWTDYDLMNTEAEFMIENFDQDIMPIIDSQLDDFPTKKSNGYSAPLFLIGSRSGWRSGSGGISWSNSDKFRDWLIYRDYDNATTIYNDNGVMYLSSADHDGTTGGTLYTLPSDESKLLQFIKECTIYPDDLEDYRGEYADGMTDDEILLEMLYDDICQDSYDIDWFNLITGDYTKYLEPITV